jgi:glycosyltransferase involved in cell wall biosynthesis
MPQDLTSSLKPHVGVPVPRARLVVFSDDWGRHPSSAQHLIRHLLPRFQVDWINTVGTHRPRLSLADLRRGVEKLKGWAAKSREPKPPATAASPALAPTVHAPVHWPGFKTRAERMFNRALLRRALAGVLDSDSKPAAVITTVPITADLAASFPGLRWIYYCVDDFAEWPGLDGDTLRQMELDLLAHAGTVICVSDVLRQRLARLGVTAHLLTHGVDLEHWRSVRRRPLCGPGRRPTVLYWGHADQRLDADICLHLAETCDVRMAGRYDEVDARLMRRCSIDWIGPLPYERLPELAGEADVLVMPYADLPVTRAMQPLKLKEYLATGLPVVATPLPANRLWADAMDLTPDPDIFARLCLARARRSLPESQVRARRRLAFESWENKAMQFEQWVMAPSP